MKLWTTLIPDHTRPKPTEEMTAGVATWEKDKPAVRENVRKVGERKDKTVGFWGAESFSWGSDPGNSGGLVLGVAKAPPQPVGRTGFTR